MFGGLGNIRSDYWNMSTRSVTRVFVYCQEEGLYCEYWDRVWEDTMPYPAAPALFEVDNNHYLSVEDIAGVGMGMDWKGKRGVSKHGMTFGGIKA
jgi:hypothetical protein